MQARFWMRRVVSLTVGTKLQKESVPPPELELVLDELVAKLGRIKF